MEKNIQSILDELYQIDPELKKHELDIERIVTDMVKNKPNAQLDEKFASDLKARILERFSAKKNKERRAPKFSFFKSQWIYALGGAALTLAIAIPVVYTSANFSSRLSSRVMKNSFTAGTQVVWAEKNAFGPLQAPQVNTAETASLSATTGYGGMGGDTMVDKRMATSLIYPPMAVNNYHFIYDGELPELAGTIEVLRREPSLDAAKQYGSVLQKLNLGVLNLGGFKQPLIQSFSFAEDRDEGYQVNIDAMNGSVSIMQNYQRWTQPRPIECGIGNNECIDPNRVEMDQIPEDARLIEIANAFLKKYGVDVSSYAPGFVETGWKIGYAAAEDKSQFYIPNIQNVIYQLMINGKPVYEEYGEPMGIRVGINVLTMKVTGVDGIMTKTFSASAYDGETSEDRIRAILKKGKMAVYADAAETIEAHIEDMEVGYMHKWQYNESKGTSYELFVPALIFSIKDVEEVRKGGYYQNTIVIPLASEMLTELEKQINEPIHIMPFDVMMKDAVSEPAVQSR